MKDLARGTPVRPLRSHYWAVGWAVILIAAAFVLAVRTNHDLTWPNEHDLYRDLASAESMARGDFGADPCYRGERIWYNPLTAALMATAHTVTGLPLPVVAARSGTYFNLAGPVLFFIMVALLFDWWTAVLALAGYLFCLGGGFPSWAGATYSPWLYPVNFVQGLFYLLIILLIPLRKARPGARWAMLFGLTLGLTFLGHTAPVVIFAVLFVFMMFSPARAGHQVRFHDWRQLGGPGALSLLIFALVISPYAASILGHYRLHIVNDIPNGYVADFLGFRHLPLFLGRHLDLPMLVAWLGVWLIVTQVKDAWVRHLLIGWLLVTSVALSYGYLAAGLAKVGVTLPLIVPSFHALFYFKAVFSIAFALGVRAVARWVVVRHASKGKADREGLVCRVAGAVALSLILWSLPRYLNRYDAAPARAEALAHAEDVGRVTVYQWMKAHARSDEVALASDDMGLFCLVPAGVKVVAVDPYFSNPYVDWARRDQDRDRMFALLEQGGGREFLQLLEAYRVTYIADESSGQRIDPAVADARLEEVLSVSSLRVYRVRSTPRSGASAATHHQ